MVVVVGLWWDHGGGLPGVRVRGGELGVLRVREHPLITKSTLSNLKKSFMKHFVILRSSTNMIT